MKNVQKGIILILSTAVLFLTFCGVVIAHPGHGTEYPDEINITAANPPQDQSTVSEEESRQIKNTSNQINIRTPNPPQDQSTVSEEESRQIKNTSNQNTDNQPVEEVTNTTEVNASSGTDSGKSESSLLNPSIIIGGFIAGFAVVGFLIKSGIL